jgi:hypothetical protein
VKLRLQQRPDFPLLTFAFRTLPIDFPLRAGGARPGNIAGGRDTCPRAGHSYTNRTQNTLRTPSGAFSHLQVAEFTRLTRAWRRPLAGFVHCHSTTENFAAGMSQILVIGRRVRVQVLIGRKLRSIPYVATGFGLGTARVRAPLLPDLADGLLPQRDTGSKKET